MLDNADANSLQHDGRFLKWKKTCTGLRGKNISTRVGLLISAVPLFEREHTRSRDPVFLLPKKLQEIISQVYHVPSEECEGPDVRKMYTPDGMLNQQGKQYRTVSEYVAMCRDVFRGENVHGKQLNPPKPSTVRSSYAFLQFPGLAMAGTAAR